LEVRFGLGGTVGVRALRSGKSALRSEHRQECLCHTVRDRPEHKIAITPDEASTPFLRWNAALRRNVCPARFVPR